MYALAEAAPVATAAATNSTTAAYDVVGSAHHTQVATDEQSSLIAAATDQLGYEIVTGYTANTDDGAYAEVADGVQATTIVDADDAAYQDGDFDPAGGGADALRPDPTTTGEGSYMTIRWRPPPPPATPTTT